MPITPFLRDQAFETVEAKGKAFPYLAATLFVMGASLLRWGVGFLGEDVFVFAAYYPAVLFATYLGGWVVGIFATILGAAIAQWAFIPPYFAFMSLTPGHVTKLLAFLFACALIIWGAESYRRLARRLRDEENLRKIAVEELAHRLKNKIATIQSIISYQLREQPRIRDDINARLFALSATDDLIMATQGRGASLRKILSTELGPYGLSRNSLEGPEIFLAPKLALTMALLVHELATNAAKHGALSSDVGKLSICWSLASGTLTLYWRESSGPLITSPARRGFGLRLLSRALDQFGGSVEMSFEKDRSHLQNDSHTSRKYAEPRSSGGTTTKRSSRIILALQDLPPRLMSAFGRCCKSHFASAR